MTGMQTHKKSRCLIQGNSISLIYFETAGLAIAVYLEET
jgi:hypothetical protein